MGKIYTKYLKLAAGIFFLSIFMVSCRKDHSTPTPTTPPVARIATLGLYEIDSSIYRRVYIPISAVGTKSTTTYYGVFDTGSTGMTIDATDLIPASMITSAGITVPHDSVVVNGITVTNKASVIAYGNAQGEIKEYGNLAYATVKIGDQNGFITTGRIPIFLYYKIIDMSTGKQQLPHSNDVFGVGPGVSYANAAIASPLSYFTSKTGGINGFKLAKFNNADFTPNAIYVDNLLTIGLVPDDISSSSGFVMHPLGLSSPGGYSADIAATITYSGKTIAATILFDTGTPAVSIITDNNATVNMNDLPLNTPVTLTTNNGFTYSYTTKGSTNITEIANPAFTRDPRTIFSINFFVDNEFLMDYQDHKIGLKN